MGGSCLSVSPMEVILLLLSGIPSLCRSDPTSVCSLLCTLHPSSVSSHSTPQFGNVSSGVACLLVCAVLQARGSLLEEWERASVTELRAEQKRTMHYFLYFCMPFISSSRLFRVTDTQLLLCIMVSYWRLYEPLFWRRIPLFMSEPLREWVFGEDRLCKSGFQKEELCVSEHKL